MSPPQWEHSYHLGWLAWQAPACASEALLLWYNVCTYKNLRNMMHPGCSLDLTPELAACARISCTLY